MRKSLLSTPKILPVMGYAHRPVDADGYIFVHCIFVGFKNEFRGKRYGSGLVDACIDDAKKAGMQGVAVVTRKGSFMAKSDIFFKRGSVTVDAENPDFELLALKFSPDARSPRFRTGLMENREKYADGLFVLRSAQCPNSEKNVAAIIDLAEKKYGLTPELIELDSMDAVQNAPCAFGTFCILYNREVISHHPINSTRFENIMDKLLKYYFLQSSGRMLLQVGIIIIEIEEFYTGKLYYFA